MHELQLPHGISSSVIEVAGYTCCSSFCCSNAVQHVAREAMFGGEFKVDLVQSPRLMVENEVQVLSARDRQFRVPGVLQCWQIKMGAEVRRVGGVRRDRK